ncbi:hypothetical protein E1A91_A09G246800v1 [Gossypium mustelinum]|uniref:Uncharacterized protein n=1 Tax=Gossypium mustelinum TaxID=34275 RepID=A0A5D2Y4W0_GOSMU|nr:hypothetical protein E1A91_A09G246800v1 [Gossypium mustelinum]
MYDNESYTLNRGLPFCSNQARADQIAQMVHKKD